jgi:hypothetical protein
VFLICVAFNVDQIFTMLNLEYEKLVSVRMFGFKVPAKKFLHFFIFNSVCQQYNDLFLKCQDLCSENLESQLYTVNDREVLFAVDSRQANPVFL